MKLINDIINELVDTQMSITSPLLKTKVLASRLQNAELLNWVSKELKGYDSNDDLPKYRIFHGALTGTYINGEMQYNDQPVPTIGLNKQMEKSIRSVKLAQSILSLENMKGERTSGLLESLFSSEITAMIQQNWRNMGNPYLQLINCKISISVNALNEILSYVRNNLLDFMLKIDSQYGNITEIEELKTKQEEIATIMNQTIINNIGDGNVLNTGDKANISADININKGNKEELKKHLQTSGVCEEDIVELSEIIDTEEPDLEKKTFGQKVNLWTQKMFGKALDGSWNIGVGAAGSVLAEAIKKYYGM
ncbi:hypothetical protein GQR60_19240 [Labilibaculum sp. A4]|uniref:AbiTii domain-containing protein n=1 Tax=Labilibaculum euxinus TaxID=2686357 RepID=UPI000F6230C1|nr:hypothetical protein [Labilibaculum euxinus]MDQ1772990.1 hypothetical protein [Labilibaculum euxinus]MWN78472.1 hypothetical protein [Labilibaculum euxinus]